MCRWYQLSDRGQSPENGGGKDRIFFFILNMLQYCITRCWGETWYSQNILENGRNLNIVISEHIFDNKDPDWYMRFIYDSGEGWHFYKIFLTFHNFSFSFRHVWTLHRTLLMYQNVQNFLDWIKATLSHTIYLSTSTFSTRF